MYHIIFTHVSAEGILGYFQVVAIANKVVLNVAEQVSLYDWASFECIPMSDISGSGGKLICKFLKNHHIYFQNGCTCLRSHQQWRIVPCAPPPLQHKLSVRILILDILVSVRWDLRAILIHISMMSMCELYLRLITWRFS